MFLDVEAVVDGGVGGKETLGRALGLELLLFPLPSSDRQMRVLSPVVFAHLAWSMTHGKTELAHRRAV